MTDIYFENIDFKQCKKLSAIKIQRCTNVTLENIEIINRTIYANHLFEISQVENLSLLNSKFESLAFLVSEKSSALKFYLSMSIRARGGVILGNNIEDIRQQNTKLINCKLKVNNEILAVEKIIYQD